MSKQNKKIQPAKKAPPKPAKKSESSSGKWIAMILLAIITLICFSNAFKNEFTNWDDQAYVTDNALIKSLSADGIKEIFSSYCMGNYHPLAVLSLAIDFNLYKLEPYGYHATSIIIHVLNVLLVFIFIRLLSGNTLASFITALFFGIHPMHVESVAWVSERKDVLYLFFYIASLCVYLLYIKPGKRRKFYVLSLVFFILSLLSKGQAVTLPVVLFLIDYFKGRKFDKALYLEKIPFLLLALGMGILAVIAQKESGAITDIPVFPLPIRILFAAYTLLAYLFKLILPIKLSAFYPYPALAGTTSYPVIYYAAPVVLLLLLFVAYRFFRKNKTVVFGVAFFIVNIFLLLQILPVGGSMMSERYTYLCYIGLFFIIGQAFSYVWESSSKKISSYKFLFAFVLLIYSGFQAYGTHERNKVWKNSEVLWTNVIKQFPRAVIAYGNRGSYYQKAGKIDVALVDFNEALRLKPDHPETLINRSDVYRVKGQYDLSIEDCNKALAAKPGYPGAYMNRGIAYCIVGRYDEAFSDFGKVIAQDPKNSNVYCNRGNLYDMKGMLDSALADYTNAIRLKSDYSEAFYNRGKTYMRKQDFQTAIENFNSAIKYNKTYVEAYIFRSQSYKAIKNYPKALDDIRTAQQMGKPVDLNYVRELEGLVGK